MGINGDVIGVLLSFDKVTGLGTLTFYKHGLNYGVAYDNIPPGTYYPILAMHSRAGGGPEVYTTLNSKAKIPREAIKQLVDPRHLQMEEDFEE